MIPMDRETLMMIATIVAVAAVIFLFREVNKTKTEVENFRNFSAQLIHQLSGPPMDEEDEPMPPQQQPVQKAEKLEE
jgi:hypothetical protein